MAKKMNNLTGKEWLQESFTIWSGIRKNKEEIALKHPAIFPSQLPKKLINIYTRRKGSKILRSIHGHWFNSDGKHGDWKKSIGWILTMIFVSCKRKNSQLST